MNVLLVVEAGEYRAELAETLGQQGYQVTCVETGELALDQLRVAFWPVVICGGQLTPLARRELLARILSVRSDTAVILACDAILENGESDTMPSKAHTILKKPLTAAMLHPVLTEIARGLAEKTPEDHDIHFCKLSIDDFVSGKEIKFDVYVRLSEHKYVKVAHQGESIPLERVRLYKIKGLKHLYMRTEDFKRYVSFTIELSNAVKLTSKVNTEKKMNFMKHTSELLMEQVFLNDLREEDFESAKLVVENTLFVLMESNEAFSLMEVLNTYSEFVYTHSLGVSLYSILLARGMDWNTPSNLSKIATAGIFHDIGKKEIDIDIVRRGRQQLNGEEMKIYNTHPTRGMELLGRIRSIPDDVLQAILQHHENGTGTGFPGALKKSQIHPFARVLAVANEFSHLTMKGEGEAPLSVKEAIERITTVYSQAFDSAVLKSMKTMFDRTTKKPDVGRTIP